MSAANEGSGLFWDGELRQTANAHVDRQRDNRPVFRLSEIISPVRLITNMYCFPDPDLYPESRYRVRYRFGVLLELSMDVQVLRSRYTSDCGRPQSNRQVELQVACWFGIKELNDMTGDASLKAILPNWIRTTPFLRNGFGCMHMKVCLLFS